MNFEITYAAHFTRAQVGVCGTEVCGYTTPCQAHHIPTLPFGPSVQLEFLSFPFPPCCALFDRGGFYPWAMVVLVACTPVEERSSWWASASFLRGPVVHGSGKVGWPVYQ